MRLSRVIEMMMVGIVMGMGAVPGQSGTAYISPAHKETVNIVCDQGPQNSTDVEAVRKNLADLSTVLYSDPYSETRLEKMQVLTQSLQINARRNASALKCVMETFRADPASELGQRLILVLQDIKEAAVEGMAQDMALSDNEAQVAAGLDLLGGLGISSSATFNIATRILEQPQRNAEILMRAIYSMPIKPLSALEHARAITLLSHLATTHADAGVRSNSLLKIAEIAKDVQDLQAVIGALDKHRHSDDRVSAAMALAQSQVTDDGLRALLLERMGDKKEQWEIRRYAAEALTRFKLSGKDYETFRAFKREQSGKSG